VTAAVDVLDLDVHDEDAPGEEIDEKELCPSLSITGDGASSVANDGDADMDGIDQIKTNYPSNAIKSSDTPPDTNGYQTALEHHQPPPPTPPVSNGGANSTIEQEHTAVDPASFLTDGGKPWYLKNNFEIDGAAVREVQWTGREVVRSMSEELSEMDDDELKGMGEEMDGVQHGEVESVQEMMTLDVPKSVKKHKARKRWRGYK